MIAEVLAAYGNEVAPHKKSTRNMGYNISNLLKWWGETCLRHHQEELPSLHQSQRRSRRRGLT